MFNVSFNSIGDVLSFVETFGTTKGLFKMGAISQSSLEYVDQAINLSLESKEVHLHTIRDTYEENNGHRVTYVYAANVEDDLSDLIVITRSGYGDTKVSLMEYMRNIEDKSLKMELLNSVCAQLDLVKRAHSLKGLIR